MTCCMKWGIIWALAYAKQTKLPIASEFCKYEEPGEMDIADELMHNLPVWLSAACTEQLCKFLLMVIWVTFG